MLEQESSLSYRAEQPKQQREQQQQQREEQEANRQAPPHLLEEHFIEVVFLLLGVGVLLPWNAYISAKPYFQSRLCGQDSFISGDIELWFSVLYNGASVFSLAVVLFAQYFYDEDNQSVQIGSFVFWKPSWFKTHNNNNNNKNPTNGPHESSGYAWYMVMIPLGIYLAVFIITTALVFLPSLPPQLFLVLTLVGLLICGICTSVACSGIVGTAGLFQSNIGVVPYFNGQAVGGLFVAVANFVATIIGGSSSFLKEKCGSHVTMTQNDGPDDCIPYSEINWATAGYFLLGCLVLAACMIGYQYVSLYEKNIQLQESKSYDSLPSEDTVLSNGHFQVDYRTAESVIDDDSRASSVTYDSYQNDIGTPLSSLELQRPFNDDASSQENVTLSVWRVVCGPAVSLFWTYFVTLAIFPVWTSQLSSIQQCESISRMRNDLFSPMSFVVFNLGDLLGRMVSAEIDFDGIKNLSSKLVLASILRFGFFILFLFCHAENSQFNYMAVQSDAFSWTIQLLFAISNGALTNISFCYAPGLVKNEQHPQQVSSAILNFSLSFGLLCGSFFSFPYSQFATGD